MSDEEYKVTGSFCNQDINGFRHYVKDGALDVEGVTKDYALNEAQIPRLKAELEAAGFLLKAEVAEVSQPRRREKANAAEIPTE